MGVTYNQFFTDLVADVIECERACFFFYSAVKNDLKKDIAEFFSEKLGILEVDSLDSLTGLFNKIASYRFMGLFSVPRTATFSAK